MHVPLHLVELVALAAVLAAPLLPALELVAELPGRYHVLPLDAGGALGLLARLIAATGQIRAHFLALIVDVAAAVDGGDSGLALVELHQILLGFAKGLGMQGRAEQRQTGQQGQGEGRDETHGIPCKRDY